MCGYIALAVVTVFLLGAGFVVHRLFKADERWLNDASEF
jgi:hypothetical protein